MIPQVATPAEASAHARRVRYSWQGALGALVLTTAALHFLYRPLDVLWFVLLRRFGL